MEQLAVFGGQRTKETPFAEGRRFTDEEKREVLEALDANTLFYRYGEKTKKMEKKMCELYGTKHAVATSSGSAAVHTAVAALGIGPGDEVLVPAITDMGSVIGILYQLAIPVFLDIDPNTYNLEIQDIERKISSRTKAILVVHYMGYPCDMAAIIEIAERYNLKVIEDCAQAWHARYRGKPVGTMGDVGCFSFNDFKHLSTGEGGICITNDGETAERIRLYTDKGYYRDGSGRKSEFLAPNYRISEICSAVAIGQLGKVTRIAERRNEIGTVLNSALNGIKGLYPMKVAEGAYCSYWFYLLRFEEEEFGISRDDFLKALEAEGIPCGGAHIATPLYDYGVFKNRNAFPGTNFPFECRDINADYSYQEPHCPNSQPLLDKSVIIRISEFYSDEDVGDIYRAIHKISRYYHKL